ncbi:hypothetical protein DB771_00465 [Burkholderia sp. AU29985]|nr:hypothetical protein XM57_18410 [Burkholderia cepacia]AYZ96678.1 hypothetical protein EGY28_16270 [Burkholderia dolosa]ETP66915.1 hypothetical protein BDSB_15015 [Burkholderia dolosa PC543]PRE53916.1 hypothetical protein C6P87_06885 [Burkholderia sp. AU12872]PUA78821.1 hypothetical protein DB771_00465 [Burkholderia sp. AU29985]
MDRHSARALIDALKRVLRSSSHIFVDFHAFTGDPAARMHAFIGPRSLRADYQQSRFNQIPRA